MIRLIGARLFAIAGLAVAASVEPACARTISLSDHFRRCLSTSIAPSQKVQNTSTCIARNSCGRTIFATFDVYPFQARKTAAPVHAKVSHWVSPGHSEVFGWNPANPMPLPECRVIETR